MTTGSIGFLIGISAAADHRHPIHLQVHFFLVMIFGDTILKHRISILRCFRLSSRLQGTAETDISLSAKNLSFSILYLSANAESLPTGSLAV